MKTATQKRESGDPRVLQRGEGHDSQWGAGKTGYRGSAPLSTGAGEPRNEVCVFAGRAFLAKARAGVCLKNGKEVDAG